MRYKKEVLAKYAELWNKFRNLIKKKWEIN